MSGTSENLAGTTAIRPFTIPVTPEAEIEALRARITATRWPDQETVADHSQGPKLAVMQELARYWATDYDWRPVRGGPGLQRETLGRGPSRRPMRPRATSPRRKTGGGAISVLPLIWETVAG